MGAAGNWSPIAAWPGRGRRSTLVEAGTGKIALTACNGQFVCAEGGGGQELIANRADLGAWETFELVPYGDGRIVLRAASGQFVGANGLSEQPLVADRGAIGPREPFLCEVVGGPTNGVGVATKPVVITAPATAPQGRPFKLPIAVVNPAPAALTLGEIEISGIPTQFDVAPPQRGREHAPPAFAGLCLPRRLPRVSWGTNGGTISRRPIPAMKRPYGTGHKFSEP
jgi:hypothetical protein